MATQTRTILLTGSGQASFSVGEISSPYLVIFASSQSVGVSSYRNDRFPQPKSFFGYLQLFRGEAVQKSIPLEYQSQLVLEDNNCCDLILERICNLSGRIQGWIQLLDAALDGALNVPPYNYSPQIYTPLFSSPQSLYSTKPTSLAWEMEPNCQGIVSITHEIREVTPCSFDYDQAPSPTGCGGGGSGVGLISGCLPTTPPGGGGT